MTAALYILGYLIGAVFSFKYFAVRIAWHFAEKDGYPYLKRSHITDGEMLGTLCAVFWPAVATVRTLFVLSNRILSVGSDDFWAKPVPRRERKRLAEEEKKTSTRQAINARERELGLELTDWK